MATAHVMSAVECLMEETVEKEIEEIKALMEEMELDSIEVELEVEVEVDSDAEDAAHTSSDDADSDEEDEIGESAKTLSPMDSGISSDAFDRDSLDSLSEDSASSGDSDCGSPAAHEFPVPKRKKAVTFCEDVEILYIEACNGGRKVSELQSPKKKASSPAPPANVKKYKLRGKDGPVFVELTEEAAAYLKFIQISREHGHNILVKDFYKEASDFAKGIMPDFITAAPSDTPLKSGPAAGGKDRRPAPAGGKDMPRPSAVPAGAFTAATGADSWRVSAHPDEASAGEEATTAPGKKHRNKDKAGRGNSRKNNNTKKQQEQQEQPPAAYMHQQGVGSDITDSPGYSVYVHNGAHYFGPAPHDTEDAYSLLYGEAEDGCGAYPTADDFAHAMVYAEHDDSSVQFHHHHQQQQQYQYQPQAANKFPYYDMQASKSARAFFAGTPGFYDSSVPVSAHAGAHGAGHHGARDSPYLNNYPQAHRPMRGRGRGQHSRQYHSSQPYRKQQGRSPRK